MSQQKKDAKRLQVFINDLYGDGPKQWCIISKWLDDKTFADEPTNLAALTELHEDGIYNLLLKLKDGDTLLVASLSNLSDDIDTLSQIILACLKNGISIIPVKESEYLELAPNLLESALLKDNAYLMAPGEKGVKHMRFIASSVLHGKPGVTERRS